VPVGGGRPSWRRAGPHPHAHRDRAGHEADGMLLHQPVITSQFEIPIAEIRKRTSGSESDIFSRPCHATAVPSAAIKSRRRIASPQVREGHRSGSDRYTGWLGWKLGECPLWVISGHQSRVDPCPLYPQKQTFVTATGMSALCQKRTLRCFS